ncbi:S8 family serine peptidase [Caulobacter mirabilis]|nr:S8 family serine peptidase [Caulobacter mirabilis]
MPKVLAGLLLTAFLAAPAAAQLPGVGGLPLPSTPSLPDLGRLPAAVEGAVEGAVGDARKLADLRRLRLEDLVRRNRRELDVDDRGAPIVRGRVLAVSPSPEGLEAARRAGLSVLREERMDDLGLVLVTLAVPAGQDARRAVKRLRRADPEGQYDFDHLYDGAGATAVGGSVAPAASKAGGARASSLRLGLVDTGLDAAHPALAGAQIEQRGFAPGGMKPAAHGLATASLMVGASGAFRAPAAGGTLLVADVYGAGPTGGSTEALLRGLNWLAGGRVEVVNISLVGPANGALHAAVRGLTQRGVVVVAAVGNDGPAAPPLYPASWPEVVAVTAVDGKDRVLLEAGRAAHLDFAAPGADMVAAVPGGGFAPVRGTSFASPIVAGLLAERMASGLDGRGAVEALAGQARDLGSRGADKTFGRGLVGTAHRTPPAVMRGR